MVVAQLGEQVASITSVQVFESSIELNCHIEHVSTVVKTKIKMMAA